MALQAAGRSPPRTTTPRSRPGWRTLGADLLLRALDERPPWREQDEDGATYAEKLTAADRTLDPGAPAAEQERVVRALHPHVGARLRLPDGSFLGVHRARVGEDGALELLEVQPPGGPADVLRRLPPRPPRVTDREVAEAAAGRGRRGRPAPRFGGALDVAYKSSGGDPVTDADRAAEAAALAVLRAERPATASWGRRAARPAARGDRRWVVDALDGTANFLHGIPHWCAAVRSRARTARCSRRRWRTRCAASASARPAARPSPAAAPVPPLDRALVATFLRPDKVGPGPRRAAQRRAVDGDGRPALHGLGQPRARLGGRRAPGRVGAARPRPLGLAPRIPPGGGGRRHDRRRRRRAGVARRRAAGARRRARGAAEP